MSDIFSLEPEKIKFKNWNITVERKLFRRSISIHLSPNKGIRIKTGRHVHIKLIEEFLLAKEKWIEKNLNKYEEHKKNTPKLIIKQSHQIPFLGQQKTIRFRITLFKKPYASIDNEYLNIHVPRNLWNLDCVRNEQPQYIKQLRTLYKREAIKYISARTQFWSHTMKLNPADIKFREQRTRWGSCNAKGVINLNWRLILFKPEIIDYVIVHEFAHLKHLNHSPYFWQIVETHLPHRKLIEKELKKTEHQTAFLNPT